MSWKAGFSCIHDARDRDHARETVRRVLYKGKLCALRKRWEMTTEHLAMNRVRVVEIHESDAWAKHNGV